MLAVATTHCMHFAVYFVWKMQQKPLQGSCRESSGGSRNLERGVQLRVYEAHPKIFGLPRPLPDVNAHVIIVATDR